MVNSGYCVAFNVIKIILMALLLKKSMLSHTNSLKKKFLFLFYKQLIYLTFLDRYKSGGFKSGDGHLIVPLPPIHLRKSFNYCLTEECNVMELHLRSEDLETKSYYQPH